MRDELELRTARAIGRRPERSDLDDLVAMWADERVTATLAGPRPRDQVEQLAARWDAHWTEHGFGPLMWHDLDRDAFVGWCGLQWTTVAGERAIELLYATRADFWGTGLTTESAREVVRWADEDLRLDELVCFTMTTNRGSQRVMEKCGFAFEREIVHADLPHVLYRRRRPDSARDGRG